MAKKTLVNIDLSKNELQNARIQNLASDPSSPVEGQIYWNTTSHTLRGYNGTAWGDIGGIAFTADQGLLLSGASLQVDLTSGGGLSLSGSGATAQIQVDSTVVPKLATANTFTATQTINASGGLVIKDGSGTTIGTLATDGSGNLQISSNGGATSIKLSPGTGNLDVGTHRVVNVTDPTGAQDAATKNYVDAVAQGLSSKTSVRAATLGTETYTIASGAVTQISGTSVDGVSPAINDLILVKDAPASSGTGSAGSSQPANGIYIVTSNTTNLSLSRASVMDASSEVAGAYAFVEGGTQASSGYVVNTPSTTSGFTINTNNIQWTQFTGAGEIIAGAGLTKSGNTLNVGANADNSITVNADDVQVNQSVIASKAYVNGLTYLPVTNYVSDIGDGTSTSITKTHGLGTTDLIVQVRDKSTGAEVEIDNLAISTTQVTVNFATAPATNAYRLIVLSNSTAGIGDGSVTDSKLASPNNSVYRTLQNWMSSHNPTTANTYIPNVSGTSGVIMASGMLVTATPWWIVRLDPADLLVGSLTAKIRLRYDLSCGTLTTRFPTSITAGLYPLTAGGSSWSPGTVVTGSTVALTPAAVSLQSGTAEFTCPSAGFYAVGLVYAGTSPYDSAHQHLIHLSSRNT